MTTSTIPASIRRGFTEEQALVYDWLAANGVAEWIPETCNIRVGRGRLVYDSFVWNDGVERGFNSDFAVTGDPGLSERVLAIAAADAIGPGEAIIEERLMPLLVPPSDEVRAAVAKVGGVSLRDQL